MQVFKVIFYILFNVVITIGKESHEDSSEETRKKLGNSMVTEFLYSNTSIFNHVTWGSNETQRFTHPNIDPGHRVYFGYAFCKKHKIIDYETHINGASSTEQVLSVYADLFRFACDQDKVKLLQMFVEKGWLYMNWDNSMIFSRDSVLFSKPELTYTDIRNIEELIVFSAFTQVYVSWYKFPVASIDPTGDPIQDAGFIELISKLHALDEIKSIRPRYLTTISYEMGMKLKSLLRHMRDELRKLHVQTESTVERKDKAINTFAVIMGLTEFLVEHSEDVLKGHFGCAHATFEQFYSPKKENYVGLATTLGTAPIDVARQ